MGDITESVAGLFQIEFGQMNVKKGEDLELR